MPYLTCEGCWYETREVNDVCKKCGKVYVCEWDSTWYENRLALASMGRNARARQIGTVYVALVAVFVAYAFAVNAVGGADREAWGAFFTPTLFLSFCTYEVWAFTRGKPTTIDRYVHSGVPKNTNWRVFGLTLDLLVCAWAVFEIVTHDA
jgi:hypothetical protein